MLTEIDISGFKSIRHQTLELRPLNVLIGANGAGKSNLLSLLDMLRWSCQGMLGHHVAESGGANSLLHHGAKKTPVMSVGLTVDNSVWTAHYGVELQHAAEDRLLYATEHLWYRGTGDEGEEHVTKLGRSHSESRLFDAAKSRNAGAEVVYDLLSRLRLYHFHDTSLTAAVRQNAQIHDTLRLRSDAGNLASKLYGLREGGVEYYRRIRDTVRLMLPFFGDFVLEPEGETILLRWREKDSYHDFGPHQLSDGALRAIALTTLLLQPEANLPPLIAIDEPELGLHPYAVTILAGLLGAAAMHSQVIVATQSPHFVDQFDPEDIVVVERANGETAFSRPNVGDLREWLDEYSLGELWLKNVVGGGPCL